jgi:ProP effector
MSNASLKDQLQAVAAQLSDTLVTEKVSEQRVSDNKVKAETHKPLGQHKHNSHKNKPIKNEKTNAAKPNWLVYVQYGVELLRAYFPLCFRMANEIKPLKKGIKQDLIKQLSTMDQVVTEDKACMVKSLSYYVNTIAYHKSVLEGVARIDLEGNPAGAVSTEEAKYSSERHQARQQLKQSGAKFPNKPTQDHIEII